MTKNRALIGVVAALAVVAAYWFLLLSPKREEAAALAAKVEQTQASVAQAEATLASYREAQAAYKRLSATVARLGKAVPSDDDVRSLIVQLESAATASEVDFRSINVGAGASAAAAATGAAAEAVTPAGPPGSTPVGSSGFSAMSFNLQFKGGYLRLAELFARLERFVKLNKDQIEVSGRLLRVEGVTLQPADGDYRRLNATVNASTYLVPAAQPLSLEGAGTNPSTATPAAGSTTPGTTTTATSTGVLR